MNLKKYNSGCFSPMHSRTLKKVTVSAVLTSIIFACSTTLYIPKEGAGTSKEELKELNLGRTAYIKKCASCHTLYLPEKYSTAAWSSKVHEMSDRAKLSKEEEIQVIKYLSGNRR